MKIDVVITSNTQPRHEQMLINCIDTLRASETRHSFNIIVVESTDKVFEAGQDKTVLFDLPKYNCNHAIKQGIALGTTDWIALASNDLIWCQGWFSKILEADAIRPDIRSWGTWSNLHNWHPNIFPNAPWIIEGYRTSCELSGWNIVTHRSVLDTIDLRETVDFWYSDNIYADELQKHGIKHALVRDAVVNHLLSQTMNLSEEDKAAALIQYYLAKD